ncbi:MAG: TRAP transporter small permease subunit [Pseudomonadota bacterium]
MQDALIWFFTQMGLGVINMFRLVSDPAFWPDFGDKLWLARFIYYGASVEFFFIVFDIILIIFVIGIFRQAFLWRVVQAIEALGNTIGRVAAWAALLMVLQQVVIVALQRVFRVAEISVGPFGFVFTRDLSWYAEELKLYNAILVTLAIAYTFVQGGHVRVDLIYAKLSHRGKCIVDMLGSLFFIMPFMIVVWLFGWFFMWRHLVTPKLAATNSLEVLERKSKLLKWSVETIGFSPNGFDAYFLFKVLMVAMAGLMFIQGVGFFYRSWLEYVGGESVRGHLQDDDSLHEDKESQSIATQHGAGH